MYARPVDESPRVLVVDDEPPLRAMLRRLLTRRGFDFRDAGTVSEATDVLAAWLPHVVLLDVGLGPENGLDVARVRTHEANLFSHPRTIVYVDQLGVAASVHRLGIGRRLMRAVETAAEALAADAVELDVRGFNEGARAFYEALGYDEARRTMRRPIRGR